MLPSGTIIVGEYRITPTGVLLGRSEYPSDETILQDLAQFASVVTFDAAKLAQEAGGMVQGGSLREDGPKRSVSSGDADVAQGAVLWPEG